MPTITFFRQKRKDGGVRTGVDVDDDTVLCRFEGHPKDRDPTLLWYIDVRAAGTGLPAPAEAARQWLADHATELRGALLAMAGQWPAGIDPSEGPTQHPLVLVGPGRRKTKVEISVAFLRRAEAARMPAVIRDVAAHWDDHVGALAGAA